MTNPSTTSPPSTPIRLGFVGGGAMAHAIIAGAIAASDPTSRPTFVVAEPDPTRRADLEQAGLARTVPAARDLIPAITQQHLDGLVLAVKPQVFPMVAQELIAAGGLPPVLVISIMAGTTIASITQSLSTPGLPPCRVVRVMPNTPARVGKACSALAIGPIVTPQDLALAHNLMLSVGTVTELPESLMDAFTAVAGSGPAFVFAFAEALIGAAVAAGIPAAQADGVVRQLLAGSVQLMLEGGLGHWPDIAGLRRAVTSPGGTTAAGLASFERDGLGAMVARAVEAARDRGRALSAGETGRPAPETGTGQASD